MMYSFERKPEDMIPLRYKVGERIMGYSRSLVLSMLVGGTIKEVRQSKSHLDDNSYLVQLADVTPPEGTRKVDWWIREKEAIPFDEELWKRAVESWKAYCTCMEQAHNHHAKVFAILAAAAKKQWEKEVK